MLFIPTVIFIPIMIPLARGHGVCVDPTLKFVLMECWLLIIFYSIQMLILSIIIYMFPFMSDKYFLRNLIPGFFIIEFFIYLYKKIKRENK